jgi:hypothetical protein
MSTVTGPIPDIWTPLWEGVREAINAAWPEVYGPTHPILRVTQAERRHWRLLLEQKRMEAPWVVIQIPGMRQADGWGAINTTYEVPVTVHYITSGAGQADIAGYLLAKLLGLERVLTRQSDYSGFQFLFGLGTDVSENNPANATFVALDQPFAAGSLSFGALIGYIVPDL